MSQVGRLNYTSYIYNLVGEVSGYFKRLMVSMMGGGRDQTSHTDPLKANQDARRLLQGGERRLGTGETTIGLFGQY